MDPDSNLERTRELIAEMIEKLDAEQPIDEDDVNTLVEHVQALDNWIRRGGFLPAAWAGRDNPDTNTFTASRSEFSRLLQDYEQLLDQVTNTQASNTDLVEENRRLKKLLAQHGIAA